MEQATVEGLAAQLRSTPLESERVDIWVAADATFGGAPVPDSPTGVVAAVLVDAAFAAGLWRGGAAPGEGGATYHFTRES